MWDVFETRCSGQTHKEIKLVFGMKVTTDDSYLVLDGARIHPREFTVHRSELQYHSVRPKSK